MTPIIIPNQLGDYYQLISRQDFVFSCSQLITSKDAAELHSIITHELNILVGKWRGILMRLGISIPPNFFHAHDIYQEIIKLIQCGELGLAKIPRLDRLPTITVDNGWGYCFTRGPDLHPSHESPVIFSSVSDAKIFVQSLNTNEQGLRLCTYRNPALANLLDAEMNITQRFIEGLASKEILAYKVPAQTAAPPVKAIEYMAATAIDREVPLAPESVVTPRKIPSTLDSRKGVLPSSLDNAENRLNSMKQEINDNGHIPKYSDTQLLQQAQAGEVANERYHVRFMEVGHQWDRNDTIRDANNLTGKLGREFTGETGTGPRYWSTTFDQIEDADTDAQLICEKLGIDYDPGTDKEYLLIIVDTEKAKPLTGCECVSATFGNISEFSNRELPKKFPKEFTDQVMTSEYQAFYKEHYQAARDEEFLDSDWSTDTKRFSKYLSTTTLEESQKDLLIQRMEMHDKIGNNQHYLGNGVTENKIPKSANRFGAVETHNFERTPINLQKLKDHNAIKIIKL
ncbi:MAG TPA: hypothetical protein VL995_05390 [Cellvibrio sp.]|nr:hypothetical protein [Cellvibrio sp.]